MEADTCKGKTNKPHVQVPYIMMDNAALQNDLEPDPFEDSVTPKLKHTILSAQFLAGAL